MRDDERSDPRQAVLGFLDRSARARATSVRPVPGGIAVLNSDFPMAHDLNRLIVGTPCDPAALAAAADEVLGGAGLDHRQIDVLDPALGEQLAAGLAEHGYTGSADLLMVATGPPAEGRPVAETSPRAETSPPAEGPSAAEVSAWEVEELDVGERASVASAEWRRDQPGWDEATIDQLGRRISTVTAPTRATFFAVRDPQGRVVSHLDLYERDGLAQIEEVMTDPAFQGRGLASRLTRHALQRARSADPVFLIADADDWPRHLYGRLGFTEIGRTLTFRTALG